MVLDHDELVSRHLPVDVLVRSEEFVLPGAPPEPRAQAGNESITVTWESPAETGSGPITLYTVVLSSEDEIRPFVFRVLPSTRSITATGLRNDVEYYITVKAHNRFGAGYSSAYIADIFPGPGPEVTDVRATPGTASAIVSWRRPPPDGSGRVIGYEVIPYLDSSALPPIRFRSSATRQRITGLTNGERYSFAVRAITAAGTGRRSARSAYVVPRGTPAAPNPVQQSASPRTPRGDA